MSNVGQDFWDKQPPSYCPICKRKVKTIWRDEQGWCAECGKSFKAMREEGLNTAGPWHDCAKCQTRHFYDERDGKLYCEKCGLTQEDAQAVDDARPPLMSYRPRCVTSGALVELEYRLVDGMKWPLFLSVVWAPNLGQTTIKLTEDEMLRGNKRSVLIAIDVPLGARSGMVVDPSGRSHHLMIPVEYISSPAEKPGLLKRLFGI